MTGAPLVCAALRIEARAVRKGWPDADVAVVGMRAPRLDAVRRHDGPVLVVGFGGGLDERQRPGDVVVATEIRDRDGHVVLPSAPQALRALRRAGIPASAGPLWCSDAIVRGSKRAALANKAIAVDMESARIAAACDRRRLVVVRVVVDTPGHGLVRASIVGGRRSRRRLREVAAAFAEEARAAVGTPITSGTVTMTAHRTTVPRETQQEG